MAKDFFFAVKFKIRDEKIKKEWHVTFLCDIMLDSTPGSLDAD